MSQDGFSLARKEFEKKIEAALKLQLPYEDRARYFNSAVSSNPNSEWNSAIPAAVLVLFGYSNWDEASSETSAETSAHVLFIRRTELVDTHKGQMAFPGGRCEPEDGFRAVTTALRETEEEVGIPPEKVDVLGELPSLITVTGYLIQPVVGVLREPIEAVLLQLDPTETAEAIWIPFKVLNHPETYRRELIAVGAVNYPIHVYQVEHHRIWGATGSMTKNLLDRFVVLGGFCES